MDDQRPYRFLFRCSQEQAQHMHHAARRERRSLNSFILQAVATHIEINRRIDERLGRLDAARKTEKGGRKGVFRDDLMALNQAAQRGKNL